MPLSISSGSAGKESTCSAGDLGSIPGLGRSPGEGKGYPPQYSGLEKSMDCVVHGVTKNQTRLSLLNFHFPASLPGQDRYPTSPEVFYLRTRHMQGLANSPCISFKFPEEMIFPTPVPIRASLAAQLVKNLDAMRETWVWSLGWEDPLEKGRATNSNILAWRIPCTLYSIGSQRVGHNWVTFTCSKQPAGRQAK